MRGAVISRDDGSWPTLEAGCMRPAGRLGIFWWMIAVPASIHWTSPAAMAAAIPLPVAVLDGSAST